MSLPTDRSNAPDEKMLNEALDDLRFAGMFYTKARLDFKTRMGYNGYTLEEYYESHWSAELSMFFVHGTVRDGWQEGLEDDSQGLIARRLVVKA